MGQGWSSDREMARDLVADFIESDAVPDKVARRVESLQNADEYEEALELIIEARRRCSD